MGRLREDDEAKIAPGGQKKSEIEPRQHIARKNNDVKLRLFPPSEPKGMGDSKKPEKL